MKCCENQMIRQVAKTKNFKNARCLEPTMKCNVIAHRRLVYDQKPKQAALTCKLHNTTCATLIFGVLFSPHLGTKLSNKTGIR